MLIDGVTLFSDVEILAIFRLCDTTKSGSISERVNVIRDTIVIMI